MLTPVLQHQFQLCCEEQNTMSIFIRIGILFSSKNWIKTDGELHRMYSERENGSFIPATTEFMQRALMTMQYLGWSSPKWSWCDGAPMPSLYFSINRGSGNMQLCHPATQAHDRRSAEGDGDVPNFLHFC